MKALLPTIIAALTAVAVAVAPQIQAVLAAHPTISVIVAAVYAIIAHWLPSPAAPPVA